MTITAPYNFVPLSAWIFQPDWKDQASMDIPFKDGYSGTLDLEITAHTPILVGGNQERGNEGKPGEVHFFKTPDGHAIPGSSLKGMVRNVLEIATFGKMSAVDDRWLSIRDLTDGAKEIYRSKFTGKDLQPRVRAGFLRPSKIKTLKDTENFCWELMPCEFCRVEQKDLIDFAKTLGNFKAPKIRKRQSAGSKYGIWGQELDISFDLSQRVRSDRPNKQVTPEHMKAQNLGKGKIQGRLVITGQPADNNDRPGKKHLEFLFYDCKSVMEVDPTVMRSFLQVHSESDEWKYWKKRFDIHHGVPVFYLERSGYPTAIGLSMMFRLAYSRSIGQTISDTCYGHRNPDIMDLPELIFGKISDGDRGIKGRVNFGMAHLETSQEETPQEKTILNGPKPSYYPSYIEQEYNSNGILNGKYKTFMDSDAEIRGWKRYPVRPKVGGLKTENRLSQDKKENNDVAVQLFPLKEGSVFQGKLRIHNLRRFELGALLWALTWGHNPDLRHSLGMGKPFGLGQVSIKIKDPDLNGLRSNSVNSKAEMSELIQEFEEQMNRHYQEKQKPKGAKVQWRDSIQLAQLLAMADPKLAENRMDRLKYMSLEEFREKKGPRIESTAYVLLPYLEEKKVPDKELFTRINRTTWEMQDKERQDEKERLAMLSKLSPTARRLKESSNKDECAAKIIVELANSPENSKNEAANVLKKFYQEKGDWDRKKPTEKLAKKIKILKKVLGEED